MITTLLLAAIMFVNFLVQAVNIRAVAFTRYGWIAFTDMSILILNFVAIKMVAESGTWMESIGYTVGGVAGALAGVWLSKHWSER
jgi:hypothetical protein